MQGPVESRLQVQRPQFQQWHGEDSIKEKHSNNGMGKILKKNPNNEKKLKMKKFLEFENKFVFSHIIR